MRKYVQRGNIYVHSSKSINLRGQPGLAFPKPVAIAVCLRKHENIDTNKVYPNSNVEDQKSSSHHINGNRFKQ